MKPSRLLAVVFLSNVALALSLRAGPPLLTDDSDTPGPGGWEVNLATALEKVDSDREWELPVLDINFGVGEHIQLKFEIPWIVQAPNGGQSKGGLGNSEIGVKWRFLDEEVDGLAMSIYPQVAFNSLQSSIDRGIVDDGSEFLLPLQIGKTFGPVFVYAEAGYAWLEHGSDEWIYGIAAECELTESFKLLGEFYGVAEEEFQEDELIFNLGFKWHFHEEVALLGSAGRSLREPNGDDQIVVSYLGLQFTF